MLARTNAFEIFLFGHEGRAVRSEVIVAMQLRSSPKGPVLEPCLFRLKITVYCRGLLGMSHCMPQRSFTTSRVYV